jgi:hypothetical protein
VECARDLRASSAAGATTYREDNDRPRS